MYTVEIRTDIIEFDVEDGIRLDLIPHTFLYVYEQGKEVEGKGYGFAPIQTGLTGQGKIFDDTGHEYNSTFTRTFQITEDQYQTLIANIEADKQNPPYYHLPFGAQCTVWAMEQLGKADIINTEASVAAVDFYTDTLENLIINPYTQALARIGEQAGQATYQLQQQAITAISQLATELLDTLDALQTSAQRSLLNGLLALSAKLGAPDLLNADTGLNDQDPAAAFEVAEHTTSPIVLDLDGDGIETLSKDQGIHFDLDNNGMAETVGWVGANDGLLVRDINGNGTIDSGAELFGNHTQLANGDKAANGYEALAELDSNGDGIISSDDTAFNELNVWLDKNSDGISQQDELISLADAGIASLNTAYQDSNDDDGHGNITQQTSTATKTDGSVIDTAELFDKHHPWCLPSGRTKCVQNRSRRFCGNYALLTMVNKAANGCQALAQTVNRNTVELSEELLALPEAYAFGNMRSLRQTMTGEAR